MSSRVKCESTGTIHIEDIYSHQNSVFWCFLTGILIQQPIRQIQKFDSYPANKCFKFRCNRPLSLAVKKEKLKTTLSSLTGKSKRKMKVVLIGRRILLPLRYWVTTYLWPYDPEFVRTVPSPSVQSRVRPYNPESVHTIPSPSVQSRVRPYDPKSVRTIPSPSYNPESVCTIQSPSVRSRVRPYDPESFRTIPSPFA